MSVRYGNKPTKWTADVEGWPHADPDRRWGSQRYWTWVVDYKYPFSLLRLQDQNQKEIVCNQKAVKMQHGLMHYVHDGDAAFWTLQELPEFRHHDQDYAHQDCGTTGQVGRFGTNGAEKLVLHGCWSDIRLNTRSLRDEYRVLRCRRTTWKDIKELLHWSRVTDDTAMEIRFDQLCYYELPK